MTALTLILGALMAFGPLSIDMYLPGLPDIVRDLNAREGAVQLTLSAFLIGLALGQAIYGPLSDKYGRKRPLLLGVSVYVVASLLCAVATNVETLIALRFLEAVGAAAGGVITNATVRDLFVGRSAASMFSMLMLVMGIAPIAAPVLGGQLLLLSSWRTIFVILAVFGVLCGLAALLWLPETHPIERRRGVRLRDTARTYAGFLRNRAFMAYALSAGGSSALLLSYITGSPFVFIDLLHVSPQTFSWLFGLNALGLIAASQVNRLLLRRASSEQIVAWASASALLWAALLLVTVGLLGMGLSVLVPLLFACVTSIGFLMSNISALALAPVRERTGSAAAILGITQNASSGIAGALVGAFAAGGALSMTVVMALSAAACFVLLRVARSTRAAA
ncbi:DHA1 family bicyclomycin/chloramphenicol resistance-like MFS transporter [Deinobacterium chartae]|uniref:DHA1 family bicyclomycin/chloramphenicol resistance-like MFS transporter n=1 Tax=Deinobacterium chartae TaxID=521158 RepID=A0A841I1S5_9DEIO|nr:multidrug effflux MFS transporter [Deinobacterium chartae]MBB6099203.1 DHA1 family bicyclomycin/chloramphenicol resistance-like MFS transporter [Deinobacterium chartae]